MNCRFCSHPLSHTLCDLGVTPLANRFLKESELSLKEPSFPLKVFVCSHCFLVQVGLFETPEQIFSDYAYFSSYSKSFLNHVQAYVEKVVTRFSLDPKRAHIVEIASNDGYLLQYFLEKGFSSLGIEPAHNVARVAEKKGIATKVAFFNKHLALKLAGEGLSADLLIANNVLAHVPDLNDFVAGLKVLLKPGGVLTLEFPHLLHLLQQLQFDTIYHEHFSYFSLGSAKKILHAHGLAVFDVEEVETHGGSLRLYVGLDGNFSTSPSVQRLLDKELEAGLFSLSTYQEYGCSIAQVKKNLNGFLQQAKKEQKKVAAYGAPAKGNTLLNYCAITPDLIPYTVDLSPHKQGLYLPGIQIPIFSPEKIFRDKPDYILILPWNLKEEIMKQMEEVKAWGCQFFYAIPKLTLERN